jgi:hypothetical protein
MNKDLIVSELQSEVARINRALAALNSVSARSSEPVARTSARAARQHWSQTPEGRRRLSLAMKRRHREASRN